jgi:hypothetical protein
MGAVRHDCALGLSMTVRSNLAGARWDDRTPINMRRQRMIFTTVRLVPYLACSAFPKAC